MSKNTTLLVGSMIFLFLGIIAAIVFYVYVGMQSSPVLKGANRTYPMSEYRVALVSVFIATLSMWIMWICTYMHQMNPIIAPILSVAGGE